MEIQRKSVKRKITEEEFIKLKNIEPFATFRQDSKAINFSFLFGGSFKKFSETTLEVAWDINRVQQFIKEKHLEYGIIIMKEKYPDSEPNLWSYYVVAKYIRDGFFDVYKGLLKRIELTKEIGKTRGYIRSHHGGIRRVPILTLAYGADGRTRKGENMKEIANLNNITANTSIQTDESAMVALAALRWYKLDCYDDAYIQGFVHDSADFVVNKEIILPTLIKMKECFETNEEWQKGIKLLIDVVVVDIEKGQYYKKGRKYEDMVKNG